MTCDCCKRKKKMLESFAVVQTNEGSINLCVECNDLLYKIRDNAKGKDRNKYEKNAVLLEERSKNATSSFLKWKKQFIDNLEKDMGEIIEN